MSKNRKTAGILLVSVILLGVSVSASRQSSVLRALTQEFRVPTPAVIETPADKSYCLPLDNNTANHDPCATSTLQVVKGTGGVKGTCGSVIEWGQRITDALQKSSDGSWGRINEVFTSCNYTTEEYDSGYVSTFSVIEAYNLAGFHDIAKFAHVDATSLQQWWESEAATTKGYKFISYPGESAQYSLQNISPGYILFAGTHTGLVNSVEIDKNGNGFISVLQSNTSYWLRVFLIDRWKIVGTQFPVVGFGGH